MNFAKGLELQPQTQPLQLQLLQPQPLQPQPQPLSSSRREQWSKIFAEKKEK